MHDWDVWDWIMLLVTLVGAVGIAWAITMAVLHV